MTKERLSDLRKMLEKLAEEAREAFVSKFPYLEITDLSYIRANVVRYDLTFTDGSLLVELSLDISRDFPTVGKFISAQCVRPFNYRVAYRYDKQVDLSINRMFYHTKKKFIFSM